MAREVARHNSELELLRSRLTVEANRSAENYQRKIDLYQQAVDPLIELVVKALHRDSWTSNDLEEFNRVRLKTIALLAMFAPAYVFHAYNKLIDQVFDATKSHAPRSFEFFAVFRTECLIFLSLVRRDVGLYSDELAYQGTR